VNYKKSGPVPAFSFCSDSNTFYECRVYNTLINVVIAKLKSSSATSFSFSRGSMDILYPSSQFSDTSLYDATVYVGTNQWYYYSSYATNRSTSFLVPISNNVFLVNTDKYGSNRAYYATNLIITVNIAGQTLYSNFDKGSKLQIKIGVPSFKSNCQVWVQN
jgi:hypothetical protein